ncbi:MAG: carbonate dehydratase [Bacteroidota bacterium]|nr:carbonate dehydratase [Bacteroidota bacterium]
MKEIFENNKRWVKKELENDPDYFKKLAKGQTPRYLWIGCADSRVPADRITGTKPGEMFVHRNIANMVVHTDINMLSVLQYAVDVLKVQDVIVCGHYGCGGVAAALSDKQFGLIDNWLGNIKDVMRLYYDEITAIEDEESRLKRMVELNVIEQVYNLTKTSIIQNSANSGHPIKVHGLVYDLNEGLLKNLNVDTAEFKDFEDIYGFEINADKTVT